MSGHRPVVSAMSATLFFFRKGKEKGAGGGRGTLYSTSMSSRASCSSSSEATRASM